MSPWKLKARSRNPNSLWWSEEHKEVVISRNVVFAEHWVPRLLRPHCSSWYAFFFGQWSFSSGEISSSGDVLVATSAPCVSPASSVSTQSFYQHQIYEMACECSLRAVQQPHNSGVALSVTMRPRTVFWIHLMIRVAKLMMPELKRLSTILNWT